MGEKIGVIIAKASTWGAIFLGKMMCFAEEKPSQLLPEDARRKGGDARTRCHLSSDGSLSFTLLWPSQMLRSQHGCSLQLQMVQ